MAEPLMFLAGLLIVGLALYDFLHTTLSLNGLGPLSRRIARGLWRFAKLTVPEIEQRFGITVRPAIGPAILIAITAFWVALHLLGYTLMFRGGVSLVQGQGEQAANWVQTIAFVGSALSTLGSADVKVPNGGWNLLSMVLALNGMAVLTLSMSYLLNILQTTVAARSFALRYNAIKEKAGGSADEQMDAVAGLAEDLCRIAVQLSASPLPAFFAPKNRELDFPATVKNLCDLIERVSLPPTDHQTNNHAQLVAGVYLLANVSRHPPAGAGIAAARDWADHHLLDNGASSGATGDV